MIAEVIVDIAHSEVDKVFDYDCGILDVAIGSRVIVPFGNIKIEGVVIAFRECSEFMPYKLKKIIRLLDSSPAITQECIQLLYFMCSKYHVTKASVLRLFLPSEMRKGRVREKLVTFVSIQQNLNIEHAFQTISSRSKLEIGALHYMVDVRTCKIAELKRKFSNDSINRLIKKGFLITEQKRENRMPYSSLESFSKNVELTNDQKEAIESIKKTDKLVTLIHGVTGSGKTVVYLRLIREAVENKKSAILLVPEISLTPQMFKQLKAEFGDKVAILHSGLSAGEKFDEWCRLRSGEAQIAVGARSAIFAPLENLGIIVIDEEHDSSYVSESNPRYFTFDIAKFRANYNSCKLVLGSATPSVETYLKAREQIFNLVNLPQRINRKPLPEMIIADMRIEIRRGNDSVFSSILIKQVEECLKMGNQAIIFLNRRGYSQHIVCRECGYVAKCENCDIALNYHSVGNILKCHYCGANYKMLTACPDCGSTHINYVGTGTQKVVLELKKLFPSVRILRMDNDTTQNKEGHIKILEQFSSHEADILVGTQMIAKGHDFPSVTLVGILDADMSLFFSDYRSGERTFQLITQVAGRSGRADDKGTVVLQTYIPDNPVLHFATKYDYEGFFEREISLRKTTFYPPYAIIVRVMIESESEENGIIALKKVYDNLNKLKEKESESFIFFNKMKSPIKRIKNKFRFQILMRIKNKRDDIINQIYELSLPVSNKQAIVYIEINPSNLS